MGLIAWFDRSSGRISHTAGTLGQIALIILGVHLAADQLDDRVAELLFSAQLMAARLFAEPLGDVAQVFGLTEDALHFWEGLPIGVIGAWAGLALEIVGVTVLCASIMLTSRTKELSWSDYRKSLCVHAVVLPVTLMGVVIAGAWSLSMAMEDALPMNTGSSVFAMVFAIAALVKFGWPAWRRSVVALKMFPKRTSGIRLAPVLLPIAILAWTTGVPLWGWL